MTHVTSVRVLRPFTLRLDGVGFLCIQTRLNVNSLRCVCSRLSLHFCPERLSDNMCAVGQLCAG